MFGLYGVEFVFGFCAGVGVVVPLPLLLLMLLLSLLAFCGGRGRGAVAAGGGSHGVLSTSAVSCCNVGTEDSRASTTAIRKSGGGGCDLVNPGALFQTW